METKMLVEEKFVAGSGKPEMSSSTADASMLSTPDITAMTTSTSDVTMSKVEPSRKWRQRGRKAQATSAKSTSGPTTPSVFNLFNCNVEYRVCGTIVMFKVDEILAMTRSALGIRAEVGRKSPVGAILKHLRTASKYELLLQDQDQSWLRSHISWKAYRDLVNNAIFDLSLKEMLNSYVPFQTRLTAAKAMATSTESLSSTSSSLPDHQQTGPTLEKDCLKLAGVTVPFVINKGRIFLDLLASFTVLGQLRLAFMNNWDLVDRILEEQGLNQKDAFRRNHKSRAKDRRWSSQRSHITFRAIKVLAEHGLVEEQSRKRMLGQVFAHLDSEIDRVMQMKQQLLDQVEAKIRESVSDGSTPDSTTLINRKLELSSTSGSACPMEEDLVGTELCDSGCGRQYHFTARCCNKSHQVTLCGKSIGYIVHKGQIFLEKCGAFSSLGRMYVIRCSDYRRSDKTLTSVGLKPKRHYLFEKQTSPDETVHRRRRNRRTHISFEAFMTLVNSGFADQARNKELMEAVKEIKSSLEDMKNECVKHSKSQPDEADDVIATKLDSSSGVESGSSHSGSGTTSPIVFEKQGVGLVDSTTGKAKSTKLPVVKAAPVPLGHPFQKIKIAGHSINTCMEAEQIFLSVSDVSQCLMHRDRSLSRLRQLSRSLDQLTHSPPFKKIGGKPYITLECLVKLVEKKQVNPTSEEFENAILVLQKTEPQSGCGGLSSTSENFKMEVTESTSVSTGNEGGVGRPASVTTAAALAVNGNPSVNIVGLEMTVRVVGDVVYLEKRSVFKLLNISTPSHIAYRSIDKTLEQSNISVDESFLYEGRRRSFMSTKALRILATNHTKFPEIVEVLDDLDGRCESLKVNRVLRLPSFLELPVKVVGGNIFLSTVHFLTAVGFRKSYMLPNPSKAYFVLLRLLKRRGVNTTTCFLKWGKSKYAHVSVYGALALGKTEFGPFRDKKRMDRFKHELFSALKENGLNYQENSGPELEKSKSSTTTLSMASTSVDVNVVDHDHLRKDPNYADLDKRFPPIRFQIKNGTVFFHRKTCFEAIGVERALFANARGYAAINNILVCHRVNLKASYIRGKQEQYAYISLQAIFVLLDSEDPLFACLDKKEAFMESLFSWISSKVVTIISPVMTSTADDFRLENYPHAASIRFKRDETGRLYFHRESCYSLSGLAEKIAWAKAKMIPVENPYQGILPSELVENAKNESPYDLISERGLNLSKVFFLPDETIKTENGNLTDASCGFIYIDTLWQLTRPDGEISRAADYHRLIWKDMLQAVLYEVPKLQIHVKMIEFREALLTSLLNLLRQSLEQSVKVEPIVTSTTPDDANTSTAVASTTFSATSCGNALETVLSDTVAMMVNEAEALETSIEAEDEAMIEDEAVNVGHEADRIDVNAADPHFVQDSSGSLVLTRSEFELAVSQVTDQSSLGDWTVRLCSSSEILLFVAPGYGASKKPSFSQPDVWAILGYELRLRPEYPPELFINERKVPETSLRSIFSKSLKKGFFNLLYTLLMLRPCFGSFNPELVETFKKNDSQFSDLIIDSKFIGSSQSGRTYAGCVRSKTCATLAESRVSDTCNACANLRNIVINRSVLMSPQCDNGQAASSSSPQQQQQQQQLSVWKVEETSVDGCTFLCPQLQSFNTSLPHQFESSRQATSVVCHRVYISNDLNTTISLNGSTITGKTFSDFAQNKQVGPLLDWVASLRICIGYPDPLLVERARYLNHKKFLLPPETRKFFDYILVDEVFTWKNMATADGASNSRHVGTLRTPSCRYVAGDFADICDQCRLLQDPLEFLGVKRSASS